MSSRQISNPKKRRIRANANKQINYLVEFESRLRSKLEGKDGSEMLTEVRRQQITCTLKNLQKDKQSLKT